MSKDLFSLAGKPAIVTGAARGLGKATAIGPAEFSADVAAVDLSIDNCQDTVATIHSSGRKCLAYACDVADSDQVRRTVEQVHRDFGRIDVLVNIAGITARIPTTEIPPDQVQRLTEVNHCGTF